MLKVEKAVKVVEKKEAMKVAGTTWAETKTWVVEKTKEAETTIRSADMAYRNPLAWDRNLRPGLFMSDPNAQLPAPKEYKDEWMGDDNADTYDDITLDLMVQELQMKGYC